MTRRLLTYLRMLFRQLNPKPDPLLEDFIQALSQPIPNHWTAWGPGTVWSTGTFLHLDSGTLDLGTVKDSVADTTNSFQVFTETLENVATIGTNWTWTNLQEGTDS